MGDHFQADSKPGSNTMISFGDMNACIYDDWRQMDERGLSTAAVPALALACLAADEYADMMERGEQVRMGETLRLRKALRAALRLAGVEASDGD